MAAQTTRSMIKRAAHILYGELAIGGFWVTAIIASDHVPMQMTETAYVPSPIPAPPAHPVADVGSSWPLLWGVLGLAVVGAMVVLAVELIGSAGRALPALADPTRCPDCGKRYEAGDDVITPHCCDREVGF